MIELKFLELLPYSRDAFTANKMVYYILEDALVPGSLATKYFRLAAKWHGHQAYYRLHDGCVMSGPQTASLLLSELTNFRFRSDETASGFCLRLRELFEDLEMVPGSAAIQMNDTQKIGYLLTGIRQEKSLDSVYVALQTGQRLGNITFEDACDDLHHRCEAIQADQLLYTQVKDTGRKLLVTTQSKRLNKAASSGEKKECLEKDCTELIKPYLPLCPLHFHQCVSGKIQSIELKNGLGSAVYNVATKAMVYPSGVPKDRLPIPKADLQLTKRKGSVATFRSAAVLPKTAISIGPNFCSTAFLPNSEISIGPPVIDNLDRQFISHQTGENGWVQPQDGLHPIIRPNAVESALDIGPSDLLGADLGLSTVCKGTPALPLHDDVGPTRITMDDRASVPSRNQEPRSSSRTILKGNRTSPSIPCGAKSIFYIDSGAGQCLSSCSSAFLTLEPCTLEVVGVAGSLPIFGRGTAIFVLTLQGGEEVLVRIHNCLYSFGEYNLISVSQMQTISTTLLDLSLASPRVRLHRAVDSLGNSERTFKRKFVDIPLVMDDGLYCLYLAPISSDDPRFSDLPVFDITPSGVYEPVSHRLDRFCGVTKSTVPIWTTSVFNPSPSAGRISTLHGSLDFHSQLQSFSDHFLAPAGLPPARKQYDVSNSADMSDLSIRFLGGGTDRILHTVSISNGLQRPPSKAHVRVPPLNFPQGNMKKFKTPRASKSIVGHLHQPAIAEVLYTDTIETGDSRFPYAQVFVDRISRFGDVVPLRSRTEVGQAFRHVCLQTFYSLDSHQR